jgi:hypothetical protein
MFSPLCNNDPCKALLYKDVLEGELSVLSKSLNNSKKRNHLYCCFSVGEHEFSTIMCMSSFLSILSPSFVVFAMIPMPCTLDTMMLMKMMKMIIAYN